MSRHIDSITAVTQSSIFAQMQLSPSCVHTYQLEIGRGLEDLVIVRYCLSLLLWRQNMLLDCTVTLNLYIVFASVCRSNQHATSIYCPTLTAFRIVESTMTLLEIYTSAAVV